MKTILKVILFVITGMRDFVRDAVDASLIDLSGQGRDKYGK